MKKILIMLSFIVFMSGCKSTSSILPPIINYLGNEISSTTEIDLPLGTDLDIFMGRFSTVDQNNINVLTLEVDTSKIQNNEIGTYDVVISTTTSNNLKTEITIRVNIVDSLPPTLFFEEITFEVGSTIVDVLRQFNITDNYDQNLLITASNIVSTDIDFNNAGTYSITLSFHDSSNNVVTQSFEVTIVKKEFSRPSKEEDIDDNIIYYIKNSSIPGYYDYHIAAKAIQGIVNRNQPNLMIIEMDNPYYTNTDSIWKDYIEEQGYELIELTSFLEILITFEHYFSDIIAINDEYKSYNNWVSSDADFGAMITAVTNYMPVPEGMVNQAENLLDIELIDSFTLNDVLLSGIISDNFGQYNISNAQEGYGFLFENFRDLFVTTGFMGLTSEAMDYAVQRKMMFFDLKPTYNTYDKELYQRICEYFNQESVFFRVYGWVDQEGSGLDFVGR